MILIKFTVIYSYVFSFLTEKMYCTLKTQKIYIAIVFFILLFISYNYNRKTHTAIKILTVK